MNLKSSKLRTYYLKKLPAYFKLNLLVIVPSFTLIKPREAEHIKAAPFQRSNLASHRTPKIGTHWHSSQALAFTPNGSNNRSDSILFPTP